MVFRALSGAEVRAGTDILGIVLRGNKGRNWFINRGRNWSFHPWGTSLVLGAVKTGNFISRVENKAKNYFFGYVITPGTGVA